MDFNRYAQEDRIAESNQIPQPGDIEYSKYFSEDMGPADELFFMENSAPRSPKNMTRQPQSANHQLMKKIGELQVEIDQYKNTIKAMTDEIQKVKGSFTDQLGLKDQ